MEDCVIYATHTYNCTNNTSRITYTFRLNISTIR